MDPHALVTDPSTIAAAKALVTPFNIAAAGLAVYFW